MANGTSQVQEGTRRYPGERAAKYFLAYVESLADIPSKQKFYLQLLRGLQRVEKEERRSGRQLLRRMSRRGRAAWTEFEQELYDHALQVHPWSLDWDPKAGFVVVSGTPRVGALLALLELLRRGRLSRVKQCLHCRSWFYARFRHQMFCPDPKRKCQWDHYHTSEWRKRNRERNKRHQREYRERIFGRKARR